MLDYSLFSDCPLIRSWPCSSSFSFRYMWRFEWFSGAWLSLVEPSALRITLSAPTVRILYKMPSDRLISELYSDLNCLSSSDHKSAVTHCMQDTSRPVRSHRHQGHAEYLACNIYDNPEATDA